jgi:aspartate/methionine/tyrosine aminotransferase
VTSSGVSALMLAMQALVGAGDEVVAVVPVWPNLTAQPAILGAHVVRFPLRPSQGGAWRLDVDALKDAVTERTRVLLVNSPNNPTGWTLTRAEQETLLAHCRSTGTWIVADEVYERIFFGGAACAPSFLDIADADDRLVVVHSFSKSFLMTGWRLGWLVLPTGKAPALAKLIEFNTSCAPVFVQRAGLAALAHADSSVPGLVERLKACRDTLLPRLHALPGVQVATPPGGLYAFFRAPGSDDSLAFAKRLVEAVGVGLAPGAAFGPEGEGWLALVLRLAGAAPARGRRRPAGDLPRAIISVLLPVSEPSTTPVGFTGDRTSETETAALLHCRRSVSHEETRCPPPPNTRPRSSRRTPVPPTTPDRPRCKSPCSPTGSTSSRRTSRPTSKTTTAAAAC